MRSIPFPVCSVLSSPQWKPEKMSEPRHDTPKPRTIYVRSLVGTILLVLGIVAWLFLLYAIFEFSRAVGEFLEVVISLGNSAS